MNKLDKAFGIETDDLGLPTHVDSIELSEDEGEELSNILSDY